MRKLKLDIDELQVTTFQPAAQAGEAGTVEGYNPPSGRLSCAEDGHTCDAYLCPTAPAANTCDGGHTCASLCNSCDVSCWPFPC